jgi:hypothetical protein
MLHDANSKSTTSVAGHRQQLAYIGDSHGRQLPNSTAEDAKAAEEQPGLALGVLGVLGGHERPSKQDFGPELHLPRRVGRPRHLSGGGERPLVLSRAGEHPDDSAR